MDPPDEILFRQRFILRLLRNVHASCPMNNKALWRADLSLTCLAKRVYEQMVSSPDTNRGLVCRALAHELNRLDTACPVARNGWIMSERYSALSPGAVWRRLGLAHHNWPGRFTVLLASIVVLLITQPLFAGHAYAQNIATITILLVLLGRHLCVPRIAHLLHRSVGADCTCDWMPPSAVICRRLHNRNARHDFHVPVPGSNCRRPGLAPLCRHQRHPGHYQRRHLRLPADRSRVCILPSQESNCDIPAPSAPHFFKGQPRESRPCSRRFTA